MIIKYNYIVTIIDILLTREVCNSTRLGQVKLGYIMMTHNKSKVFNSKCYTFFSFFFFFNQNIVDA